MSHPRLLTIVLNYCTPEMSLEAVEAALRAMQGLDGEVNLVDNDSADGSYEKLVAGVAEHGWEDRVRVLQAGQNGGFGAGNNFGIRAGLRDGSRPDLVYILNSDAFPAPDAIRHLMAALEADPKAGFAGSYIHGPSGEAHMTAFRFPSITSEFEGAVRLGLISRWLGKYAVPRPLPIQTEQVDWLAGASILMRQDLLDEIGLFDEKYFLYFEETDLCLRAHRAGRHVLYVRASEVAHIGGVSTGMKRWKRVPEYWYDSRLYYFTKNHGQLYALAATAAHVSGGLLWRLRRVIQRKPRVEPPQYLRNLALHYLKTRVSPRSARQSAHAGAAPSTTTPGKPEKQTGG